MVRLTQGEKIARCQGDRNQHRTPDRTPATRGAFLTALSVHSQFLQCLLPPIQLFYLPGSCDGQRQSGKLRADHQQYALYPVPLL